MKKRSFEELTPLDVLLLSFVKYGLATSYDLHSQAGMSVGLTRPALERLREAGLLTGSRGERNSMRYAVTEKGEEELQAALNPKRTDRLSWLARYDSYESAPRAMFLAWLSSEQKSGMDYVNWSIEELWHRSREKEEEAQRHLRDIYQLRSEDDSAAVVAKVYWWMKSVADAALLNTQAEVLERVAPILSKIPPLTQPRDEFLKAIKNLQPRKDLMDFQMEGDNPPTKKSTRTGLNYFQERMPDATREHLDDLYLQGLGAPPNISSAKRGRKPHR